MPTMFGRRPLTRSWVILYSQNDSVADKQTNSNYHITPPWRTNNKRGPNGRCDMRPTMTLTSDLKIDLPVTPDRSNVSSKGKGLDTCYSATYTSQTRDQQRFTISEVAADWHDFCMCMIFCFRINDGQITDGRTERRTNGVLHVIRPTREGRISG